VLKNYFFAGILKVTDENRRIRIQDPHPNPDPNPDPDPLVKPWIRRSGSTQKCHGSATPELTNIAGIQKGTEHYSNICRDTGLCLKETWTPAVSIPAVEVGLISLDL
jgi:hypothetical protein